LTTRASCRRCVGYFSQCVRMRNALARSHSSTALFAERERRRRSRAKIASAIGGVSNVDVDNCRRFAGLGSPCTSHGSCARQIDSNLVLDSDSRRAVGASDAPHSRQTCRRDFRRIGTRLASNRETASPTMRRTKGGIEIEYLSRRSRRRQSCGLADPVCNAELFEAATQGSVPHCAERGRRLRRPR